MKRLVHCFICSSLDNGDWRLAVLCRPVREHHDGDAISRGVAAFQGQGLSRVLEQRAKKSGNRPFAKAMRKQTPGSPLSTRRASTLLICMRFGAIEPRQECPNEDRRDCAAELDQRPDRRELFLAHLERRLAAHRCRAATPAGEAVE
jgi:hypothetical protein